ncbi:hypothetical protein HH310_30690 [Actinoplanes sp. TBRC 11911]|uniref:hypothetical protein n=1 Tax=Actinoplanes sp. TBRC 11911 TaxID=2729386 RepID=UPI00145E90DD|nr:hypothetical protein [Actinoplanes sp. TBRC 11911]NMO55540.1 hypothetical protein [Actinoplanes sp. TBRC 11911]
MERGPVALFGAIVAVGLGPALWLGVQFGAVEQPPINHQPAVIQQKPAGTELFGGTGAGQPTNTPEDHEIRTTPHRNADPVTRTPSRKPTPSPSPSAEPEPSKSSSPSSGTSTDPSDPVSHPAGDDPTDPSNGDTSVPPDPPDNSGNGGTGNGNQGSGDQSSGDQSSGDQGSIVAAHRY